MMPTRGDTIEVVNMEFSAVEVGADDLDNTLFGFDKNKLIDAAEIIIIAIMIILVLLLVIQPMISKVLATEGVTRSEDEDIETNLLTAGTAHPALEGPDGAGGEMDPSLLEGEEDEDGMIDVQEHQW